MKFTSFAIALLAFAFSARPATVTYTPGTGVLLYPENFFEANSNSIVQAIAGAFPGTGSGNASTNVAQGWSALQVFDDVTILGDLTVPGTMTVGSVSFGTPLGFSGGGHGATTAAGARTNLGVVIGYDVQAQDPILQDLADLSLSDGDMLLVSGTDLSKIATTSAGRALLTAANAAAQWSALQSSALQSGAYDAGTWDGVTDKAITPDQFRDVISALPGGSNAVATVTPPLYLSNGVLWLDTDGLGGGGSGGYTYLATNVGGAFQSRADGTNWAILSTTISSNNAPAGAGRFLDGGFGLVITNNSGTSANISLNVIANETTVFRDTAGVGTGLTRAFNSQFWLVRETDTTAAFISVGGLWGSPAIGYGDFGGTTLGASVLATNITWDWSTNNTLNIELQCDTSTSTNSALGMRLAHSYLRAEAAAGSSTGDVVGPASSTDDNIATFNGTTGKLIQDGGVPISSLATVANPIFTGTATFETINTSTLTVTNPFPARGITNATASRFAVFGADYRLTNDVAETGSGAPVRATAPTFAGVTINDTLTFEQATLSAHSSVTNFVADPTVAPYQTINADLTTAFTGVRFLHATNVAAGRQTTVLVFAGTNAAVSVALNSQFAFNTNLVSLTTGQVLPVSFYGYGSSPTNVIATLGTIYTR